MKHPETYKTFMFSDPENEPGADVVPADPQKIAEREKELLTPILQVRVHGPSTMLPLDAVVDTGASRSLFSCDVMETLGYAAKDLVESDILLGSGPSTQYQPKDGSDVLVEIPSMNHSFRIKPTFLEGLTGGIMLLGRMDFFQQFLITFDQRASTFWLEPYKDEDIPPPGDAQ
jgi:hypothetical protein